MRRFQQIQIPNTYYFICKSAAIIDLNIDSLWFFKISNYMEDYKKYNIDKPILIARNKIIVSLLLQFLLTILRLTAIILTFNVVLISINALIICFIFIGLIGAILMNIHMISLYLGCLFSELFIILILTFQSYNISSKNTNVMNILIIYFPVLLDYFFLCYSGSFILKVFKWHQQVMLEHAQEQSRIKQLQIINNLQQQDNNNENKQPAKSHPDIENTQNMINQIEFEDNQIRQAQQQQVQGNQPQLNENKVIELDNINKQPMQQSKDEQSQSDNLCSICLKNPKNIAFYNCGHIVCCINCAERLRRDKCPICRKKITDILRIYNQ